MPGAHRANDRRSDSTQSKTNVSGQNTVYVNNQLWAVENDQESDGQGHLISKSPGTILINNKKAIVEQIDDASPDSLCPIRGGEHCHPHPNEGSSDVIAYG
jgi:hypothetical protein